MNQLNHVAIIMDGNGRWGLKKKKNRNYGHLKGLKAVEEVIKAAIKNKIPYLTLYTFSTENWRRPRKEVNFLFDLIILIALWIYKVYHILVIRDVMLNFQK